MCFDPDPDRDAALVHAAQGGNSLAFEMLQQIHGRCTCRLVITKMLGSARWNTADRQDAFQEAWIRIWAKLQTLRNGAKFCAFARRFAANVCLEMIRDPWGRNREPLP